MGPFGGVEEESGKEADTHHSGIANGSLEFVAGPEIKRIGLAFCTMPPEPLVIKRVTSGTWAASRGIEPGDVVEAVNGRNVLELTAAEFKELMQLRPVSMRIGKLPADEESSEESSSEDAPVHKRGTVFDTEKDLEGMSAA